jgi:hypothetical protein
MPTVLKVFRHPKSTASPWECFVCTFNPALSEDRLPPTHAEFEIARLLHPSLGFGYNHPPDYRDWRASPVVKLDRARRQTLLRNWSAIHCCPVQRSTGRW